MQNIRVLVVICTRLLKLASNKCHTFASNVIIKLNKALYIWHCNYGLCSWVLVGRPLFFSSIICRCFWLMANIVNYGYESYLVQNCNITFPNGGAMACGYVVNLCCSFTLARLCGKFSYSGILGSQSTYTQVYKAPIQCRTSYSLYGWMEWMPITPPHFCFHFYSAEIIYRKIWMNTKWKLINLFYCFYITQATKFIYFFRYFDFFCELSNCFWTVWGNGSTACICFAYSLII